MKNLEFGLAYTEMVSSKGLFYNDEKTKLLLNTENEQIPVAAQIFGNDIEAMSFAAKELSKTSPIIDINMGCPAPKVVKNGDGSKLLLNLELAGDIIEAVYLYELTTTGKPTEETNALIDEAIAAFDALIAKVNQKNVESKKAHFKQINLELEQTANQLIAKINEL